MGLLAYNRTDAMRFYTAPGIFLRSAAASTLEPFGVDLGANRAAKHRSDSSQFTGIFRNYPAIWILASPNERLVFVLADGGIGERPELKIEHHRGREIDNRQLRLE